MSKKIAVGILGGTGYGAGELLRLFAFHPQVDVVTVVSSSQAGSPLTDAHPHLRSVYDSASPGGAAGRGNFAPELKLSCFDGYEQKVLFAALPHGITAATISEILPSLREAKIKLIDLSGDFRLTNQDLRAQHYPESMRFPGLKEQFVYGLPELGKDEITQAELVSNPGCLSTACVLAAAPLLDSNFSGSVIFDAKTGTSGAGRTAQDNFHHPKRHSNMMAYKMLCHRHEPEVLQALGDPTGRRIQSSFVPHLLPSSRGIFVTAYFSLPNAITTAEASARFESFYAQAPFVRVVSDSPDLQSVLGSNFCDVSVVVREKQVVAMAALDNLVKGMAGQAIQNMNLLCHLPETTGLWFPGMGPI